MWLRIRRVLAARWWISRVVRLASWILAKCVICIEIGHLFFFQERKMMCGFLIVCHLVVGVIMGIDGRAINGSRLGSRQLKVLAVIVGGCTRKGHLD
jgi:hypothetical protein